MDQAALGLMLQHLREKRGLKLRELAQLANVDHVYIYRLETGAKERPSDEVLSKLIRGVRAGNREAAMLRYLAEHTKDGARCPFHKLELYEIGELPATRMLWSSSCRTF